MDLTEYVREFRRLQKTQKIRVSDYCREMMLDYYEMVEALKKDKFLSGKHSTPFLVIQPPVTTFVSKSEN